ncbi:hypothetical protein VTK73DRAFT_5178 [Phialemonium thermophilum]|uniref:AAR2 protein n=1 Tax=Phialemonium thermophilum TaxID=223376 RepID=A0ABR3XXP4_9PEZI
MPFPEEEADFEKESSSYSQTSFSVKGDVFLILDLPAGYTVGIDTFAITAKTSQISGFRDIPPGPHFLWVSEPNAVTRCGCWFVTTELGEVHAKQFTPFGDILGDPESLLDSQSRKAKAQELYSRLLPHDYGCDKRDAAVRPPHTDPLTGKWGLGYSIPTDSKSLWRELTSAISPSFLSRITGKTNVQEWLVETSDSAKGESTIPAPHKQFISPSGGDLNFTFAQDIIDLDLLNASSIPGVSNDPTSRILALLNTSNRPGSQAITESDIVAELQFTFITGLHIGNYACLEKWWDLLLKIILRANQLVLRCPSLCEKLLRTLHCQLIYSDRYITREGSGGDSLNGNQDGDNDVRTGILDTIPQNKPKLRRALSTYIRRVEMSLRTAGTNVNPEYANVTGALVDLEMWFWEYGWDLRRGVQDEPRSGDGGRSRQGMEGTFDDDRDDNDGDNDDSEEGYAPVVVELDDQGREVGLLTWD